MSYCKVRGEPWSGHGTICGTRSPQPRNQMPTPQLGSVVFGPTSSIPQLVETTANLTTIRDAATRAERERVLRAVLKYVPHAKDCHYPISDGCECVLGKLHSAITSGAETLE